MTYHNAGPDRPYTPKFDSDGTPMRPALICAVDYPGPVVRTLLEVYYRFMHYEILYVSDKEESERPELCTWMREHHCPPGSLYLGGVQNAYRNDIEGIWDVKFVVEGDEGLEQNWWRYGLHCLRAMTTV